MSKLQCPIFSFYVNFKGKQKTIAMNSENSLNNEKFDCGVWNLTEKEDQIQQLHSWWIQGVASLVVGSIGFVVVKCLLMHFLG